MDMLEYLRGIFPGREEFSDDEVAFALRVVEGLEVEKKRNISLPTIFTPIGGILTIAGHSYRCELRPKDHRTMDCCIGCDFSRKYRGCNDVQCSYADREDGRNVWYIEVE